jgi:L-iditol 2-dehydrogenase
VAVEPLAHRRELASVLGATSAVSPGEAAEAAAAVTAGFGVDVAVELAGTDEAIAVAIEMVRPGGRVVLGGIPDDDRTSFAASAARRKGLSFFVVRRMKEVYERAIALVGSGAVDADRIVSDRYPLDKAAEAMASAAQRNGIKTVVVR